MKSIIRCKLLSIIIVSSVLLTACTNRLDDLCIQPVEKIAYPLRVPPSPEDDLPQIVPMGNWRLRSSLPEAVPLGNEPQLIATSSKIWVLPLDSDNVYLYDVNGNEWKAYNKIGDALAAPRNIFLSQDGVLWGVGTKMHNQGLSTQGSLLSRYDSTRDEFEFVYDVEGLLEDVNPISSPIEITEDESGKFWFLGSPIGVQEVYLFSFDPITLEAEKLLTLPGGIAYSGPVADSKGRIWFYRGGENNQLLNYLPITGSLVSNDDIPNFNNLGRVSVVYLDQKGRLWLDNKGWLDLNLDTGPLLWYQLIPSPVFLTDNGEGLSKYGWLAPTNIFQSSNGWLWFTTSQGIIQLNSDTGEWCKFTTGSSPVTEDQNGTIWITVFNNLYSYNLDK